MLFQARQGHCVPIPHLQRFTCHYTGLECWGLKNLLEPLVGTCSSITLPYIRMLAGEEVTRRDPRKYPYMPVVCEFRRQVGLLLRRALGGVS
jgi:hypothetical protein